MVVSSSLPKNPAEVRTFLRDTRVALCTLSMITSPTLKKLDFYKYMPVNNVVVDEGTFLGLYLSTLIVVPFQRHKFN
jgi:hypothetical protein